MSNQTPNLDTTQHPYENLIQIISPWVAPLGYRVIHLEVQSHRQNVLRIFIDRLENLEKKDLIGIEDCVKVTHALEEHLDQAAEINELFNGTYELEVSSPGVDRPLRSSNDFQQYSGREVRVHVYRPLTQDEIENHGYLEKNPKQKNFYGTLIGIQGNKVVLNPFLFKSDAENSKKSKAKKKALLQTNSVEGTQILIPLPLISKANLEPKFEFGESNESE